MSPETIPGTLPAGPPADAPRLVRALSELPAAVALYAGPDHVFVAASEAYRRIVRGRELIGRPILEVLPELVEQGFVALLDQAYAGRTATGTGVRADWDDDGDGAVEPHFIDFTYQPLHDPDGSVWGVVAYVADVTARQQAQEALGESEARFRAIFESAAVGIALLDMAGATVAVNDALASMLGYTTAELSTLDWAAVTHPGDVAADLHLLGEIAAGARSSYQAEKRYLHRDGHVVWGALSVSLVRAPGGEPLYVLGVVQDVTERRRLDEEAEEARARLQEQATELESQAEELQEREAELETARAALETANAGLQRANDEMAAAMRAAEGERARAAFLAEASRLLAGSLDYEATLRNLATAAVPFLGDWCAVDMLEEPDSAEWPPRVRRIAVVHQDPARVAWARELERERPTDWSAPTGLPLVLRGGVAEFYAEVTDEMMVASAKDEEELALLRQIGFSAYLCVPLRAWDRVLGAITLCMTESGRRYEGSDLLLAEELARRAAVAVDHSRLYAAEREARAGAERAASRIARLQRVTAALSEAPSADTVAAVVVEQGTAALGATGGVVALLSEDGAELRVARWEGFLPEVMERFRAFPVNASLPLSDAVREGGPVYVGTEAERRRRYPQLAEAFPAPRQRAWANLPLVANGRVLGGMSLAFAAEQSFGEEDRAFLEALAQQCAQALDRARLFEAERAARAAAEAAASAKGEFLAVMSHELRTPLNAILGYLDLLDAGVAGDLSETQLGYLGRVTASGKHLLGLIEEVLTFSRIEAGREEAAWERVPVEAVARQAAALVEPLARARGLEFRVEVADDAGEMVTDAGKLRQVLVNLLGNAAKFTDHGEVVLRAAPAPDGGAVLFRVRDTGIGIAPEARERIFEPFWQAAQGTTRRAGGTGLGLAVARELARLLGGDVTVESQPGRGSTFTLATPREPQPRL